MKYLKIFILVFFLFILGQMRTFSQDKVNGIIVELSSGQKMEFRLDDHPKFVFDGQTVKLTADGVRIEYAPLELMKVTMGKVSNVSNGIEEHISTQNDIKVEAGFIRLNGFNERDAITVYSFNGAKQAEYRVGQDGSFVIPVSSLPMGMTIIKINKQSIKILR